MELICGIFLTLIGSMMLIKPKKVWLITESWKTKANSEPTELYLRIIRIGGCILILGGLFAAFHF